MKEQQTAFLFVAKRLTIRLQKFLKTFEVLCTTFQYSLPRRQAGILPFFQLSVLCAFVSLWPLCAKAQQFNLQTDRQVMSLYENIVHNDHQRFHTSIKPYLVSEISKSLSDSLKATFIFADSSKLSGAITRNGLSQITYQKFTLKVNPEFNVNNVFSAKEKKVFTEASIGGRMDVSIGKNLSGSFNIRFTNGKFPDYIDNFINRWNVIPGQGYAHKIRDGLYRYQTATGYVSYTPSKYFNIQVGYGKHFWGDGYRSLLLSENANNYNYLRLTTQVWKIKYVNLYSHYRDVRFSDGNAAEYSNKFGAFHYLSWQISKRIALGLYEGLIWEGTDTTGNRSFEINYLNPIIFYRPIEFSLNSPDNVLIGLNLKVRHFGKNYFYGQIMIDEFLKKAFFAADGNWRNKQAFQVGLKGFDFLGVNDLYYQTEFNYVRPYTYTHFTVEQNYGHFNQPLAHPYGANFWESVSILRYRHKQWFFEGKFIHAMYGEDDDSGISFGKDIYQSYLDRKDELGNFLGQGVRTHLRYFKLSASWLLNPEMNLRLTSSVVLRNLKIPDQSSTNLYFSFGIRTTLDNYYYDF